MMEEPVSALDKLQKILLISLVSISAASWLFSRMYQLDMMSAMMEPFSPLSLSVFVSVWTAGTAAMMFPAIAPVVLLYNKLIKPAASGAGTVVEEDKSERYRAKMVIFVGSYLAVWSLTGVGLLFAWTTSVRFAISGLDSGLLPLVYGSLLLFSGLYQFSPLKSKCLGYCESPMSLFMRRWKGGSLGALSMGTYHGLYCLGCCWPYFMIMVALGWMDIGWMALFSGIIFAEKLWSKGIWAARAAGAGLVVAGILAMAGVIMVGPAHDGTMSQPGMDMSDSAGKIGAGSDVTVSGDHSKGQANNGMPDDNSSDMTM